MHHHENPPLRQAKNKVQEDIVDRYLPELLFYMEEIRGLVRKYSQVVQRYYVQYLSGYDAIALGVDHVISTGRRMTNLVANFECLFC